MSKFIVKVQVTAISHQYNDEREVTFYLPMDTKMPKKYQEEYYFDEYKKLFPDDDIIGGVVMEVIFKDE